MKIKDNGHFITSIIKSIIRIVGYIIIPFNIIIAVVLLVIAEGLGILEQIFEEVQQ